MTRSLALLFFGLLCFTTPYLLGRNGPTDDFAVNLFQKFSLQKFLQIRGIGLFGFFLIIACLARAV